MKEIKETTHIEINNSNLEKNQVTHGGARANAGRPSATKDKLTIGEILSNIQRESNMTYAEVLARDFQEAREAKDRNAMTKYHNLILTRVAPSLQRVEVTDSTANMEAKAHAFVEAIRDVVEKEQLTNPESNLEITALNRPDTP